MSEGNVAGDRNLREPFGGNDQARWAAARALI
jgi:hypothetical protein